MNITAAKIELARKILDTKNKDIIRYIISIFESQSENWFENLPEEIQASTKKGLNQSKRRQGRPHSEVMRKYKKWQSR